MQFADINIGILLARRARYLWTCLWMTLAVLAVAYLAYQFSGRQPATVALDVGISTMRLLLPLLIIFLVQELLSREFDRRYFLTSLSYPRPRYRFLLSRLVTVLLLAYVALIIIALALSLLVSWIASGYQQASPIELGVGYWLTMGFMAADLFVLTAMAGLLSVVAVTPSFVLVGTLGFMLVARSYTTIIALLENKRWLFENSETYSQSLGILNFLLPDLGALDIRMISLYGKFEFLPQDWLANLAAAVVYALALVVLATLFLQRKRFS